MTQNNETPARRQRHGQRPSAADLKWDETASAGATLPADLQQLKALPSEDECWVHIYPSDLNRMERTETHATVFSVAVGRAGETSVPLYTSEQVRDLIARIERAAAPTDAAMRDCDDCDGTGRISPKELCARCDTSGILPQRAAAPVSGGELDERALFEAEYRKLLRNPDAANFTTNTDGDYAGAILFSAWRMWQARAAVSASQAAPTGALPDSFTSIILGKLDEYGLAVRDDNDDWRSRVRGEISKALFGYRAAPVASQAAPKLPKLRITLRQAMKLVEFFGGHDADVTVTPPLKGWEQTAPGLYAYCTEYPEDGAQYLGPTEVDDELMRTGLLVRSKDLP